MSIDRGVLFVVEAHEFSSPVLVSDKNLQGDESSTYFAENCTHFSSFSHFYMTILPSVWFSDNNYVHNMFTFPLKFVRYTSTNANRDHNF